MSALKDYLEELHRIRASGLATNERSYYPALDANYTAIKANTLPLDLARLGKPSLIAEPGDETL